MAKEKFYCDTCGRRIRKGFMECIHCKKITCFRCFRKVIKKWQKAVHKNEASSFDMSTPFGCDCEESN